MWVKSGSVLNFLVPLLTTGNAWEMPVTHTKINGIKCSLFGAQKASRMRMRRKPCFVFSSQSDWFNVTLFFLNNMFSRRSHVNN